MPVPNAQINWEFPQQALPIMKFCSQLSHHTSQTQVKAQKNPILKPLMKTVENLENSSNLKKNTALKKNLFR